MKVNMFSCVRYLVFVAVLCIVLPFVKAQYEDVRCKCICPKEIEANKTTNVHIKTVEADQCTCEHIVKREEKFCLRCQCSFEARNTLLIKVIIILVLVCIGALLVYMICLLLISRNRSSLSVVSDERQEELRNQPALHRNRSLTIQDIDKRVSTWQNKLSEQRDNVYRTHTMLN